MLREILRARVSALVLASLGVPATGNAQASEALHETLRHGLEWYFHWVKPMPASEGRIGCRGAEFPTANFAYCEPGEVILELPKTDRSANHLNTQVIFSTTDEYTEALTLYQRSNGEAAGGQTFQVTLSAEDITQYEPDSSLSATWMNATKRYMETYLRTLKEYGGAPPKALFPLVAKGDPFYHVYVLQGSEVESVWEFVVTDGIIQGDHQKWVYDRPHRNIPTKAEPNASDPQRWYAVIAAPQD